MRSHDTLPLLARCWIGSLAFLPVLAQGACPDQAAVAAYVADFKAVRASRGFGREISLADAQCAQAKLVQQLQKVLGPAIGYKAAFTNPAAQARVGMEGPAWGVMFGGMMLESGVQLPAKFGVLSQYEPDLIAVVKSAGLADARTPLEALQHIAELVPFIELPDLMIGAAPSGAELIAVNVAFRGGVRGRGLPVQPTQAFLDALANMTVVVTEDQSGKDVARVRGNVLLGHPINAAMWLARELEKAGIALEPGDLLSLGGYLPPAATQPGTTITVRYVGLADDPSVTVSFQ